MPLAHEGGHTFCLLLKAILVTVVTNILFGFKPINWLINRWIASVVTHVHEILCIYCIFSCCTCWKSDGTASSADMPTFRQGSDENRCWKLCSNHSYGNANLFFWDPRENPGESWNNLCIFKESGLGVVFEAFDAVVSLPTQSSIDPGGPNPGLRSHCNTWDWMSP